MGCQGNWGWGVKESLPFCFPKHGQNARSVAEPLPAVLVLRSDPCKGNQTQYAWHFPRRSGAPPPAAASAWGRGSCGVARGRSKASSGTVARSGFSSSPAQPRWNRLFRTVAQVQSDGAAVSGTAGEVVVLGHGKAAAPLGGGAS